MAFFKPVAPLLVIALQLSKPVGASRLLLNYAVIAKSETNGYVIVWQLKKNLAMFLSYSAVR